MPKEFSYTFHSYLTFDICNDKYIGVLHQILVHDDEDIVILRESVDIYWGLVLPIAIGG